MFTRGLLLNSESLTRFDFLSGCIHITDSIKITDQRVYIDDKASAVEFLASVLVLCLFVFI